MEDKLSLLTFSKNIKANTRHIRMFEIVNKKRAIMIKNV